MKKKMKGTAKGAAQVIKLRKAINECFEQYDMGFATSGQVLEEVLHTVVTQIIPEMEKSGFVIISKSATIGALITKSN